VHLLRRFLRSLWWGPPRADDLVWVESVLAPGERVLFDRLPRRDQRHLAGTGRRLQRALAGTEHADDPRWLAAALLHDVGKHDARLGVYGRIVATVCGHFGGRDMPYAWSSKRGFTRRVGLYLRHGELGADMIRLAGGHDEAARWSAAHHFPDEWATTGIPGVVVEALVEADHE